MEIDGRSSSAYNDLVQRVSQKLSSWKFLNLSHVGKVLLINAIIASMASHIMATYQIPKIIRKKISSLMLWFWWSTSMDKKPIYWRKTELLEYHKHNGGLGMRNIFYFNSALLFRQAWECTQNRTYLLVSFLRQNMALNGLIRLSTKKFLTQPRGAPRASFEVWDCHDKVWRES